ncbi:hypothetical protein ACFE04_017858 [Oxalis oulophora]
MASKPGILTNWPWHHLGSFKYLVLAPWAIHSTYSFITKEESERDLTKLLILPLILWRYIHNQLWISLARYRTAKGNNRIVDKGVEFEQVDRESNWDDQILLSGLYFYAVTMMLPEKASRLPMWRSDGVLISFLLHIGPVEFLYYWFHRALHHHFLYTRYHSHHHSSIVTEPITSVVHPFAEHIGYFLLFSIAMLTPVLLGTGSNFATITYITYMDFMNNMGHCNFEFVPKTLFSTFPFLKYVMYTPTYHSLHHTQFRTNYSLFMPFYDYIYGTVDKSSDSLYEKSLRRGGEQPDVVHLTHLTTPDSIYHLRLGFAYLAARPLKCSKWSLILWPVTCWSHLLTWFYGSTFVLERNSFKNLKLQSWVVPAYNFQYIKDKNNEAINKQIEEAILDADSQGVKVLTLGLHNQSEELNKYGELYVERNPKLNIKVVDGSSLATAIVINTIPKGTSRILFRGQVNKIAFAIVEALAQTGIKVDAINKSDYKELKLKLDDKIKPCLAHSTCYDHQIWLVGEGLSDEDQRKASKGTIFIPFSQFPPKKIRKDCFYGTPPAMIIPKHFENLHSCENWLPRKVISAWRIAGIVHALEGWKINESGDRMCDIQKVWQATLRHGFRPLNA